MSQVNFKVLDLCPSRRASAEVHVSGIYGLLSLRLLFQITIAFNWYLEFMSQVIITNDHASEHLGGVMQEHASLAFAFSYSLKYALSKYVDFSWYLECICQFNFDEACFGASGRGIAGAHMSGICIFILSKNCSFKICWFQLIP